MATDFEESEAYLAAGRSVRDAFPDGAASLAVPTWFYGHEPTNQFATHIAKYFANSIREDGLLALATRGVVFAPGSAGTVQEVFQDATQNHYRLFSALSPMVFLDAEFWRHTMPAEPLLRSLAGDLPYADLIGVADTAEETMSFLASPPAAADLSALGSFGPGAKTNLRTSVRSGPGPKRTERTGLWGVVPGVDPAAPWLRFEPSPVIAGRPSRFGELT